MRWVVINLFLSICTFVSWKAKADCEPPRVLIVLDKSSSMVTGYDSNWVTKWTSAIAAVETLVGRYGSRIDFGLMVFPYLDHCQPGQVVIDIGSNTSERALGDRAAYIASKGGVASLTRAIAVELAEHEIRVNCVVPGYIYTERWDTLTEEIKQRRWKNVPLGKESSPEDIGEAAAFLASSKAGNITGSSLLVSGGVDIQLVPPDCAV